MNLLVLGATGRTGREIVDVALARGHQVTAYVRSPQKITRTAPALVVTQGGALDAERLCDALSGKDAVLSALGLPAKQALRPSTFMAESAATTVVAMQRAGVGRLGIVSAAVLFPARGLFFAFFRRLLRNHARDLSAMEAVVQATDLDWTIARPPRLVRGTDESRRVADGRLPDGGRSVSFRAVGAFLVECVEEHAHARQIVGVAR
jgi:putative NADH-flavin reductase